MKTVQTYVHKTLKLMLRTHNVCAKNNLHNRFMYVYVQYKPLQIVEPILGMILHKTRPWP